MEKATREKREESLQDFGDTMKRNNIHVVGIPEEEFKKKKKNLFKAIIAESFPTWEEKWASRFMRPKGFQTIQT